MGREGDWEEQQLLLIWVGARGPRGGGGRCLSTRCRPARYPPTRPRVLSVFSAMGTLALTGAPGVEDGEVNAQGCDQGGGASLKTASEQAPPRPGPLKTGRPVGLQNNNQTPSPVAGGTLYFSIASVCVSLATRGAPSPYCCVVAVLQKKQKCSLALFRARPARGHAPPPPTPPRRSTR